VRQIGDTAGGFGGFDPRDISEGARPDPEVRAPGCNDPSDDEDVASLLLALGTMKRKYLAQPAMRSGAASP
jgi:hypothetical protein